MAKRVALLGDEAAWYWTRSPGTNYDYPYGNGVRNVSSTGEFYRYGYDYTGRYFQDCFYSSASGGRIGIGVRPALNLKSEILVSEIRK